MKLEAGDCELRLVDLTGFDGRCDCIYLTTDQTAPPPPADEVLSDWRRKQLGLSDTPQQRGPYDLVVIGGGYAGMGSAISAASKRARSPGMGSRSAGIRAGLGCGAVAVLTSRIYCPA